MPVNARRDFLQKTLGVLGLTAAGAAVAGRTNATEAGGAAAAPAFQTLTGAAAPHVPVRIIDTETMPWPEPDKEYGWKVKTLFMNEQTGDHLVIIAVAIGAPVERRARAVGDRRALVPRAGGLRDGPETRERG